MMKTPEWYASYARLIPAMTAEQKLVYLEMADCIDSMKLHIDAFESVAPTPGAVEDVMRENFLQNTKIQLLESTYSQLSKSLCGKENATPSELLQAVSQVKDRLAQAERERDAAVRAISIAQHYIKDLGALQYGLQQLENWDYELKRRGVPENTKEETK